MVSLLVRVVHVAWCETLQVDQVAALVSPTDALYLYGACDLNLFAGAINHLRHLETELFSANLLHEIVEMLASVDCLVLVNAAIFCQRCQIIVVEYARDNTLSNNSVSLISYNSRSKHVQPFTVKDLQSSQAEQVVVRLRKARIVLC